MPTLKPVKIFLGSSVKDLKDERKDLGDFLSNTVSPIFSRVGFDIKPIKYEDIHTPNKGGSSQDEIDEHIRHCNASLFLFKGRAGKKTIHEFELARELQDHPIFVYCLDVSEDKMGKDLQRFLKKLEKEDFYPTPCKDMDALKVDLLPCLFRLLLGEQAAAEIQQESDVEKDGDARFREYEDNTKKQLLLRAQLHQDIDDLLQQIEALVADNKMNVAVKIAKVLELYKKADLWASKTDYDKEKYSDLLFDYAQFLDKYGLYRDAEEVYLLQIPLAEELYGKEHENTATSYNNIGLVYDDQGNYPKALEYYGKALEIYEKVLGKEHPYTATDYNNIGGVYYSQSNYPKALEYYKKALAIKEKVLGEEHPSTATSYNNIGTVYDDQGNYPKALEYYGKALGIREKVLGKEHPDTATSYNNIGTVYDDQGDYPKALEYHGKALVIREKVLGKEHPFTATSYNNIGLVYDSQGDYPKALEYYGKALEIKEKVLGKDHPATATSYNNIGSMYYEWGKYPEALGYLEKALKIRKAKLGEDHPNTKATQGWIDSVKAAMENEK